MGKRKRLQTQPDIPFSVASVPDRSLSLVGAYVVFRKKYAFRDDVFARKGDMGIIVRDPDGKCKPGQIPVKIKGDPKPYYAVPRRLIVVQRASR